MLKNFPGLIIFVASLAGSPSMLNASQPPQKISAAMIARMAATIAAAAQPVISQAASSNAPGFPEQLATQQLSMPTEINSPRHTRARNADDASAAQQAASSSAAETATVRALAQESYPIGLVFPTDMAAMTSEEDNLLRTAHALMGYIGIHEVFALLRVSKHVRNFMQSILRNDPAILNYLARFRETYGQPTVIRPDLDDASNFEVFAQQFYTQLKTELSGKAGCHVGIDLSGIEGLRLVAPDIFANFMHTIHRTIADNNCCFVRLRAREIGLEKLDPSIFAGMHDLKEIDLTNNAMDSGIPSDIFKDLTKLTCLTLDTAFGDAMDDPNPEASLSLNHLTNLRDLVLFGCHLDDKSMPATMFDAATKLKRLVLGFNPIEALRPRLFQNLHALQVLDLSMCDMETLDKDLFKNLHELKTLRLNGCSSLAKLPQEIFSGLTKLKNLDLSENGFTQFPDALRSATNLRSLNIRSCPFEGLPKDALLGLVNLKKLDLSSCELSELPAGLLDSTTNLKKLNLSSNILTELPKDIFRNLTLLEVLDVRHNRFSRTQLQNAHAGLRHICEVFDSNQEAGTVATPESEEETAPATPEDGLSDA